MPEPRIERGAAVILMDPRGRVLLQQRDDRVPPEGYGRWALAGGHMEGDETPRETALREFREETGVALQRLRFFRTFTGVSPNDSGLVHELHIFFADDEVEESALEHNEGITFRYWSPAETRELPINPFPRGILDAFFAHDQYLGTLAVRAPYKVGVSVIELDRWGRALLQLRDADLPPERCPNMWSIPGGLMQEGEAPDACALREFEEETGILLEDLRFFHAFRRDDDLPTALVNVQHVYYIDADLDEAEVEVLEGQAFRYFAPAQLAELEMPPHARTILERFFASTAYRALFH
jgi:8-oxo-dGTP diphosphatase